ncbi:MAG TPA: AAA family ATPase [Sphaerochaeta sp.]|nr:AAA family ATPase [Sphaerochaeta sp.]
MAEKRARVLPLSYEDASFSIPLETIARCKAMGSDEVVVGQPRALRSLEMGLSITTGGYNIYVSGDSGSGRHSAVKHAIEEAIREEPLLFDIAYVHNFGQPDSPMIIVLPAGIGKRFSDALLSFNQDLLVLIRSQKDFLSQAQLLIDNLEERFSYPTLDLYYSALRTEIIRLAKQIPYLDEEAIKSQGLASKYQANLVVNHEHSTARPFITEGHPSHTNLFGSVDTKAKHPHLGLHAGSLLLASGGFILIDAEDLLSESGLWEALKRFLDANALAVSGGLSPRGEIAGTPIRPQMASLPVKVILIGTEETYDMLSEEDDRFLSLFKVSAQFDYQMELNDHSIAQTIANILRYQAQKGLLPITDCALAEILRYSAWYVESRSHLSTHFSVLYDLIEEASWWAKKHQAKAIDGKLLLAVNAERDYISSISEMRINEEIQSGELIISLSGTKVGVVNGLAVIDRGAVSFGTPTVISCTVAPGSEGIVNIEHEAGLSGEIHDKGLLILEGYLRKHYARSFPLSIYAGIAFEQSYAEVDGDSASSSELYALLSAVGELPVRQDIAVTGSVNQMGMIQPVGGINEKIEGFFRTCRTTGLTGRQGVIIPIQNVRNLILSAEVLEAIEEKQFFLWAISTIDEGMVLLTDRPAGVRNAKGNYPTGNFNYLIEARLKQMYQAVSANRG